jgi:peptide/nickel transport system substrate-binding protein
MTITEGYMHKRFWLFAGVIAVGVAAMATVGATASFGRTASLSGASLHAAPFNAAAIPDTVAARKAKKILVFGMEQDVTGFNLAEADETAYWAALTGETPVIRGAYIIDQRGNYHLDQASRVKVTKKTLTITIRKNAFWMWGKKKVPVTNADYAYTWKQFMDPKNNVASTTGYSNISGYTLRGKKTIIFHWKPGQPFADYRDLFGYIYPSFALKGLSFNTFWLNCVCGFDGKPVSDGPFYVSNYSRGQGVTLRPNPFWYGHKPGLKEIDFKLITDTNSEIQAMRGGEVDAINPSPQTALASLIHQRGIVYSSVPGFIQEHWDIGQGPKSAPLLKQPWMRQAIALGMNRQSLINALYGQIAPGLKPLNNGMYEIGPNAKPWFNKWNFNPTKAIDLLKKHCTGGPSKPTQGNSAVWTCGGQKAEFRFQTTAGNQRRATSAAIFSSQLGAIGIKLNVSFQPANPNFFGQTLPSHDFDLAEYAWLGSPDPSGFDAIYQCVNAAKNLGGQNYKEYCNRTVDRLVARGDIELNAKKRTNDYQTAAKIIANDVAIIPLYSSPSILAYKSSVKGMGASNNPTQEGPTWNAELWHWGA